MFYNSSFVFGYTYSGEAMSERYDQRVVDVARAIYQVKKIII